MYMHKSSVWFTSIFLFKIFLQLFGIQLTIFCHENQNFEGISYCFCSSLKVIIFRSLFRIYSEYVKKNRNLLKHWQPTSLLNSDYKILTKALAIRIKDVLPEIIQYLGDAIRIIEHILHITNEEHIPGIMVAVDFEKAFDSIEWGFIQKALSIFNFGLVFKKWINIIYNDMYSCIINNSLTSGYFNLMRGVEQGDPLLPYLFLSQ